MSMLRSGVFTNQNSVPAHLYKVYISNRGLCWMNHTSNSDRGLYTTQVFPDRIGASAAMESCFQKKKGGRFLRIRRRLRNMETCR